MGRVFVLLADAGILPTVAHARESASAFPSTTSRCRLGRASEPLHGSSTNDAFLKRYRHLSLPDVEELFHDFVQSATFCSTELNRPAIRIASEFNGGKEPRRGAELEGSPRRLAPAAELSNFTGLVLGCIEAKFCK